MSHTKPLVTPRPASPLRPLEVATGLAGGLDRDVAPLGRATELSARKALETVLREALCRPPCLISFSGGRDSSSLLAAAVAVARREGLPDPIPATLIFPSVGEADEEEWQTLVLDHLGVAEDWQRFRITDELDAVGPAAQALLRRHGLFWPCNLHLHVPIFEVAAGGSIVTGFGGDEIAQTSEILRSERMLAARSIAGIRDLRSLAFRLSPAPLRFLAELPRSRGATSHVTWLSPRGQRAAALAYAAESASIPLGWGRILRRYVWRYRYIRVCKANFEIVGETYGVRVIHPFVEAPVLQSLAATNPFTGLGDRAALLHALVGDLLPRRLIERTTKAVFTDPLWTQTALAFAAEWSGRGLDERLVDPKKVRATWLTEPRNALSTTLLQAAWLADHGGNG